MNLTEPWQWQTLTTEFDHYSFLSTRVSFVEFFKSKHFFKNCGHYCERGLNKTWGWQILLLFLNFHFVDVAWCCGKHTWLPRVKKTLVCHPDLGCTSSLLSFSLHCRVFINVDGVKSTSPFYSSSTFEVHVLRRKIIANCCTNYFIRS